MKGGYFKVVIPMSQTLINQINSVKNPISSNFPDGQGNSSVSESDLRGPTKVAKNAAPAERDFYRVLDSFKVEGLNFGVRLDKLDLVRADYLKTIKFASDEFVDLVKTGQITFEEGARRANGLRNVIFEISRRKDYDLGRSLAEYYKPGAKPFEWFLERYS